MSFIELLFALFIGATLSTIGAISGKAVLTHAKQTAALATTVQDIYSQFTFSSLTSTPQIYSSAKIISAPKTVRFNYGESVTPSSLMFTNQSSSDEITLSIRGRVTVHHVTPLPSG